MVIGITQIYAQCYQCDNTTASGAQATSVGTGTTASGENSFAGGILSTANGDNSFVFGANSTINGDGSIGLGTQVNTLQNFGIAIGNNLTSNATNSYVFGRYLTGSGSNSITLGMGSSGSPLTNNISNSIMFGVNEFPSLTIHKPAGATKGYLGIGTDDPQEMAHIVGTLLIDRTETTASSLQFKHPNTKDNGGGGPTPAPYYWDIYSDTYGLRFNTKNYSNSTTAPIMVINRTGSMGIGIATPQARLHVDKNILAEGDITTLDKFVFASDVDPNSARWEISRTSAGLNYVSYYEEYYKAISRHDILFVGNNGRIGIGKTDPLAMLDVNGSLKATTATISGNITGNDLTINTNANIAGSITAGGALSAQSADISGAITAGGALTAQSADISGAITAGGALSANSANIAGAIIVGGALSANSATITGAITAEGALSAPSANIKGKIKTKEVEVTLEGWGDFVFEEDYNLMPLTEVKQFITENKHLPNVPSAAEVEANGINLGEMNNILIQKVEELTLYILDLQNQINELKTK